MTTFGLLVLFLINVTILKIAVYGETTEH